jgi:S-disulfanyl-L-cysteine oxidoreductase SoxD
MRALSRAAALLCSLSALLSACAKSGNDVTTTRTAAAHALPSGERYALGAPIDSATLTSFNVDAGPGGADLPSGSGTVVAGDAIYVKQCARCHGVGGVGMSGPPAYPALVGRDSANEGFRFANQSKSVKTIGNYWPHAYTVFDYIKRSMPHDMPRSLTNDEIYAVTAYLLHANGLLPQDATLDAASLRAVKMPYQDRFVPDDRSGGPVVR